ncbi:MAG: hypothetical protein F6K23_27635 [Okeania sp. SIO2C9]|uniref:hypothetical protein n=1 Tax=Okeania sp. SIO2C9 TaxID=2607791 RepID=UPI0013C26277|nr:hypothetical protein [Okeania sp. SIO2C9]NEQ76474.1 hypothetical protein [Okeania sp. SIO2C9]
MKNIEFVSRIIVFLALVIVVTFYFREYSLDRYNQGILLDKKEYISNFDEYKNELLSSTENFSLRYSLTSSFIALLIIVGGYELIVFIVSLLIKLMVNNRNKIDIEKNL